MNISQSYLQKCLGHLVNEVNSSSLKTIYTYTGDQTHSPVYYEETVLFKKMIEMAKLSCQIIEVSDTHFSPLKWDSQTSLLHIPGAMSSALDVHIGSKVTEIQKFVEKGGKFLGWCGGGYWACRKVCYRSNDQTTIDKIRDLALWKGVEKGPLLPFLGNPEGNIGFFHGAVPIKWTGTDIFQKYLPKGLELNVLLSGGGSFIPAQDEYRFKILATYQKNCDYETSYAGVKTYVGEGTSILINPYFTHGADYFRPGLSGYQKHFPEHNWAKIVDDLEGGELPRTICFVDMLLEATQKRKE